MRAPIRFAVIIASLAIALHVSGEVFGQGFMFPWTGAKSRAMGGASVGAPIDAASTVYWNPAAMSDMAQSELSVSVDTLYPILETDSSIFGVGAGSTSADPGVIPLPHIGWVHVTEDPRLTFGLAIVSVGGAKTNYPASATNPLFTPQSNTPGVPGGFGQLFTEAQFVQIVPALSYILNDRWSIGFAPTITLGSLAVDPFVFGAPNDADGSGQPRYPSGRGSKMQWGGGFQVSAYFKPSEFWSFGASFKSPQWMDRFDINGTDELGLPANHSVKLDLPMVISLGMAYTGICDTLIAFDARYVHHSDTDGYDRGFLPTGALAGLHFGNEFSLSAGIQRRLGERLSVRGGYTYLSNPLSDQNAMVGVAAPLFYQHVFHGGFSLHVHENAAFHLTYSFAPENELSGPILSPLGPVPGSNVTTRVTVHAATLGMTVKY